MQIISIRENKREISLPLDLNDVFSGGAREGDSPFFFLLVFCLLGPFNFFKKKKHIIQCNKFVCRGGEGGGGDH